MAHVVSKDTIITQDLITSLFSWTTTDLRQVQNLETGKRLPEPGFTTQCYRWQIVDFDASDLVIYLTPSTQQATVPLVLDEIKSIMLRKPVVVFVNDLNTTDKQLRLDGRVKLVAVSFTTGESLLEEMVSTTNSRITSDRCVGSSGINHDNDRGTATLVLILMWEDLEVSRSISPFYLHCDILVIFRGNESRWTCAISDIS